MILKRKCDSRLSDSVELYHVFLNFCPPVINHIGLRAIAQI